MTNKIFVTRTVDGFTFIATAEVGPMNFWTLKVWEIPYRSALAPKWTDKMRNNLGSTLGAEPLGRVWEEIADMIDVALHEAKSREALNAGPYSDQQSRPR